MALLVGLLPAGAVGAEVEPRGTDNVCIPPFESTFTDLADSAHEDNVRCMADYELTAGTGDGTTYSPRLEITRAQMASFIARLIEHYTDADLPEGDERFDDVPDAHTHADNIHKLLEAGVTAGTSASDGAEFAPEESVTRGQMASFIARAWTFIADGDATPTTQPPRSDDDFFPDDDDSVHEENINALAAVGIVAGFDDGDYRPEQPVLRDQMASFVMRGYDWAVSVGIGVEAPGNVVFNALLPVGGPFPDEMQSLDGASFVVGHTIEDVLLAVEDVDNPDEVELDLELDFRAPGTDDFDDDVLVCEQLFTADSCGLLEAELADGNPFTGDQVYFDEEPLTIPPDAATGDWELRFQAVDGDDEVWFADTFTITVKAQIQAEVHFAYVGGPFDGATFMRGQDLDDMHLEIELLENPDGESFEVFYIVNPPDVMFPDGPEFCDELFTEADCAVLDDAVADASPISDTTVFLDAQDGVTFNINEDAPLGEWMISFGLQDDDGEVRGFLTHGFEIAE